MEFHPFLFTLSHFTNIFLKIKIFQKLKTFLNWHSPLLMKGQSPDICKGDFLMHIKSNTRRFAYGEYGKPP